MSYILDALKKAADQRGANATALLRPSAPMRRVARLGRLPWIIVGALLLLNIAGVVYLLRPAPVITPAPQPVLPKVALIQPIEPPAPPPPTQVIPVEPPRPAAVKPPAAPEKAAAPEKIVVRSAPDSRVVVTRPAPVEPRAAADSRVAAVAPPKADGQRFKLEVLSYSDVPAQRLVFINGRRYREGETMDGSVKVEEIREDSVILSEAGQRFTLR